MHWLASQESAMNRSFDLHVGACSLGSRAQGQASEGLVRTRGLNPVACGREGGSLRRFFGDRSNKSTTAYYSCMFA